MGTKEDSAIRTARKQHICQCCGKFITKGQRYLELKCGLKRSERYCSAANCGKRIADEFYLHCARDWDCDD